MDFGWKGFTEWYFSVLILVATRYLRILREWMQDEIAVIAELAVLIEVSAMVALPC